MVNLTDRATLRAFLAQKKVSPDRTKSQNFLVCQEVVEATVIALQAGPSLVTELGPGVGTLTQAMIAAGLRVRAIEKDTTLAEILPHTIPRGARELLTLITGDLREEDWTHPHPYQLVGNIPYHLSGWIIRAMTELDPAPTQVVLLVQKEVGQRLVAAPPHLELIGLAVQLWAEVTTLLTVPPSCFWPQPTVSSQLVLISPHNHVPAAEREGVMTLARHLYKGKRKQIGGQLARVFTIKSHLVSQQLHALQIRPEQRPQELTIDQWRALTHQFKNYL